MNRRGKSGAGIGRRPFWNSRSPRARNEIGTAMSRELEHFVGAAKADDGPRPPPASFRARQKRGGFSGGADLRELYQGAVAA